MSLHTGLEVRTWDTLRLPADTPAVEAVYLLHAELKHPVYGWQHYIGWSLNLDRRLQAHYRGEGSRVTREWCSAGVPFRLVRFWLGEDRHHERSMQRVKGRNLCPDCLGPQVIAADGHGGELR